MHRNTFLLVSFLGIIAALIVGVNIGKNLGNSRKQTQTQQATTQKATPSPTPALTTYSDTTCGFSLRYPKQLSRLENGSGSAVLVGNTSPDQGIIITCQKNIPKPALSSDRIDTLNIEGTEKISTVTARLYHDASAKDGTPIDKLIFRQPKTGYDIFIAGYGDLFGQVIHTLTLQ